jgi:ribosomal protein S27AE
MPGTAMENSDALSTAGAANYGRCASGVVMRIHCVRPKAGKCHSSSVISFLCSLFLVKEGSLWRGENLAARFALSDEAMRWGSPIAVNCPICSVKAKGVVAEGALDTAGTFRADTILAKHDERYMPKEVADALKKQGDWEGAQTNTTAQGW